MEPTNDHEIRLTRPETVTLADWLSSSGDVVRLSSPSTRTAAPATRTEVVSSSSTAEDETLSHFVTAKKAARHEQPGER
jgi:hypothetical protein